MEADSTVVCQRNSIQRKKNEVRISFSQNDRVVSNKSAPATLNTVSRQNGVIAIQGKEYHSPLAFFCHFRRQRIIGLENSEAVFVNCFDNATFYLCKLFNGFDIGQAQMVPFANVRYNTDVTHIESETFAKDAAASGFQNGGFDRRIHQDCPGALWSTAITGIDSSTGNVDAVRAGHSDFFPAACNQVCNQASCRGFAINTRHANNRNASVVVLRIHHVDDRLAYRARQTRRGLNVHSQAWPCIDLNDDSTLAL